MNNSNPEISIIIPIYNVQDYLERCLESVKNQSFQNWEAICINDGSTDDSLKLLKKHVGEDDRFSIIEQTNQGVSAARNAGLAIARGKYVMFLDSDDFIHPQCMETAYNAIIKAKADICDFRLQKTKEWQNVTYPVLSSLSSTKLIRTPLRKIIRGEEDAALLSFSKKLYKAKLAKKVKFRPIPVGEDILYSFEIMDHVEKCVQISNILLYYLQRGSSVSHESDKIKRYKQKLLMVEHLTCIIQDLCQKYSQTAYEKELQRYLSRYLFKVYTRRICKLHLPDLSQQLNANMKVLNAFAKKGLFNCKLLTPRFRLMFWLLRHKCCRLAVFLA